MTERCFYLLSDDHIKIRCGRWASSRLSKKGTVVLLTGRTEYMEKYSETVGELNQRGFDVYSFDWRGQGLSDRLLPDRLKGFVKSFDDYLSDLHMIVKNVIPPDAARPLISIGHSMGGHLALRYISEFPPVFSKAVLISPMIDIDTFPTPKKVVKYLFQLAVQFGRETDYIIGSGYENLFLTQFDGNLLTSDSVRFDRNRQFLKDQPYLAIDGVTCGWLSAAFESIEKIDRYDRSVIPIPVLMIGGTQDKVVSVKGIQDFCRSHDNCECNLIPDARHEIFLEKDRIRNILWEYIDRFL